jgi:hypothetical protein
MRKGVQPDHPGGLTMYVVARTGKGRPTLMHIMRGGAPVALCGVFMQGWSRAYFDQPIPQILCIRCNKIKGR